MSDPRFPLGVPLNRSSSERLWLPIANRPGWLRHRTTGKEIYIDPPKKLVTG